MTTSGLLAWEDFPTYHISPENVEYMFIQENGEYLCFTREASGKLTSCQLWLFKRRVSENLAAAYPSRRFSPNEAEETWIFGEFPEGVYETESVLLNLLNFSHIQLIRVKQPKKELANMGVKR